MEHLIMGLYVLSLLACCVCLWFWYELESYKDYAASLRYKLASLEQRLEELEKRRR